nr:immunoglobulin heavy chain junction region [Mus musculus]
CARSYGSSPYAMDYW